VNITFHHASAGSGKTYRIETEVASRLASGTLSPNHMMVVTFTVKAADELSRRISGRLLQQGLPEIASGLADAKIGTVHSVFGQILGDFAFELGLPPTQRVIDNHDKKVLLAEALDDSLSSADIGELNQLAERLHIESWMSDILDMIESARLNGISKDTLSLASNDSVKDFLANCPPADPRVTTSGLQAELETALSDGLALLKPTKGLLTSLDKINRFLNQRTLTWEDWGRMQKLTSGKKEEHILANVRQYASQVLQHPDFQRDIESFIRQMMGAAAAAMQRFSEIKAQRGLVDFIDQEALALKSLEHPRVRQRIGEELTLLIVDEFQDTSPLQLAVFSKLAALANEVLFVGDAKQAIYGFRGADPKLTLDVIEHVQRGGGALKNLGKSWRSRAGLVHFCNAVFVPAFAHLLDPAQVELTPQTSATLPTDELVWWKVKGRNQEQRATALASGIQAIHDEETQVWDKHQQRSRKAQWRDIAVLTRSNDEAAKLADACVRQGIPVALCRNGLMETPEVMLTLACLRRLADPGDSLASAEIVSLAAGRDAESWLPDRINAIEAGTASDWDNQAHPMLSNLSNIRAEIGILSPSEALSLAIQAADIHRIIIRWGEAKRLTEHRLANIKRLKSLADDYTEHCRTHHLAGTVSGFLIWLRSLERDLLDEQAENPGNALYLGTYHSAKGLEWPIVVCASLNSKQKVSLYGVSVRCPSAPFDWNHPLRGRSLRYWPNPFPEQQANDPLTEALRHTEDWRNAQQQAHNEGIQLLYVGMTRARDQLILTEEGKEPVGEWLSLLKSPLFPITGSVTLNNGAVCNARYVALEATAPLCRSASSRARHWFAPSHRAKSGTLDYFRPASSEASISTATAAVRHDFGARIALPDSIDREQLGIALHHCLALLLPKTAIDADRLKPILRQYPCLCIDIEEVIRLGERVRKWIKNDYPGAIIHTEFPCARQLSNGQLQQGRMDLVLEFPDRWVIVDHKSSPQPKSAWVRQALEYSGQLASYREALTETSGKPVAATLIHFTTSGGIVEVKT
jgi:ATP-dependent helicase/nuclease subunit A